MLTHEEAVRRGKMGGRPPLAPTRLDPRKRAQLLADNESPLDIMIENMVFWARRTHEMEGLIEEVRGELTRAREAGDGEEAAELSKKALQMLGVLLASRQNAQECAVDAAPYFHPKLQSVTLTSKPPAKERDIDGAEMSATEAAELYATTLRGGDE